MTLEDGKQPVDGGRISPRDVRLSIEHSAIYPLGECLSHLKTQRVALGPEIDSLPLNLGILLLSCAFVEASLSRGLVHAAQYRLFDAGAPALEAEERKRIEAGKAQLLSGDIYGNPFAPPGGQPTYASASISILGFSPTDGQVVPEDVREGVWTLFRIRNILIHGQTFLASAFFSGNLVEPVSGYEGPEEARHQAVVAYLKKAGVWDPKQMGGNLAFPYASNAIVDHLLGCAVGFLRAMRDGIKDQQLQYAFGAGWPQYHFQVFAGEAVRI